MQLQIAGHMVDDPLSIWRSYAEKYARTIREYDRPGQGTPDQLSADEAGRSRKINSRLSTAELGRVVERAATDCPWDGVPQDADLVEADPADTNGLFKKAAELYWHFFVPEPITGVGVAKVHKILHIKRPAVYPILDSKVRGLYRDQAHSWLERLSYLEVSENDSPPYWAAIRDDVLINRDSMSQYRRQLANDPDERVALMADLTNLRLQDIVSWWITGQQKAE